MALGTHPLKETRYTRIISKEVNKMNTMSARGIGHPPKGPVPSLLALVALGLLADSGLNPKRYKSKGLDFYYGAATMVTLYLLAGLTDTEKYGSA